MSGVNTLEKNRITLKLKEHLYLQVKHNLHSILLLFKYTHFV